MLEHLAHSTVGFLQASADAKLQERIARIGGVKSDAELLAEWKAAYRRLEAENFENHKNAVVNRASWDGYEAQIKVLADTLRSIAPNHPVFAQSGLTFKDGKPKSKFRVIWEKAFDDKLKAVGGVFAANPKAYRIRQAEI